MQGIVGVFYDVEIAKKEAIAAIKLEKDDYHTMIVAKFPDNTNLARRENYNNFVVLFGIVRNDRG